MPSQKRPKLSDATHQAVLDRRTEHMRSDNQYHVRALLGIRLHEGRTQWLVDWEGNWGDEQTQWIDESDINPDLILFYKQFGYPISSEGAGDGDSEVDTSDNDGNDGDDPRDGDYEDSSENDSDDTDAGGVARFFDLEASAPQHGDVSSSEEDSDEGDSSSDIATPTPSSTSGSSIGGSTDDDSLSGYSSDDSSSDGGSTIRGSSISGGSDDGSINGEAPNDNPSDANPPNEAFEEAVSEEDADGSVISPEECAFYSARSTFHE